MTLHTNILLSSGGVCSSQGQMFESEPSLLGFLSKQHFLSCINTVVLLFGIFQNVQKPIVLIGALPNVGYRFKQTPNRKFFGVQVKCDVLMKNILKA